MNEDFYKSLFEHSPISLWVEDCSGVMSFLKEIKERGVTDVAGHLSSHPEDVYRCLSGIKVLDVNKATLDLYEASSKDELLAGLDRVFCEESFEAFVKLLAGIAEGDKAIEIEGINKTLTGRKMSVALKWSVPPGYEDTLSRVFISIMDVTERKRMDGMLQINEARYRAVVEDQTELICRFLPDGTLSFVNEAYCKYFGKTREELVGESFMPLIPDEDQEKVMRKIAALSPENPVASYEHRVVMPDGVRWMQWTDHAIFDGDGRFVEYQSVGRDITETRRHEEEHLRVEKLESIGMLAGGIAHDFNNILVGILGNITVARAISDRPGEVAHLLEEMEKASIHAKDLTHQLLTFAKGGEPVKRPVLIKDLINDSAGFALRGSNVLLEVSLPDDIRPVEVDPGQMNQVISNIVINADQAMPSGGIVSVRAENVRFQPDNELALPAGEYVKVSIKDQGTGIPEEHLRRIFDPYFTTKQRGSGLGLATAYSVVKKHGGSVTVGSSLGQGAEFCIYLPAFEGEVPVSETGGKGLVRGKGRVLLMDDNELVRVVVGRMLDELGYESLCVEEGEAAVEAYRDALSSDRPFDAVIMDLTVKGGLGGEETMQKLREIDPGVRALVSSGYADNPIMSNYGNYGFSGVIAKPYDISDLGSALERLMGD